MDKIGRYSIKKKIGSGGMANVYLAHDDTLGRDVAVKVLHPHLAESEKSIKRFENEAATIAVLSHENIIKLFDFGHADDQCFLAMEFVEGLTIHELVEKNGPLPNLVSLALLLQVFSGLSEAHEKGVCHRDIKPSNIMVDRHGCVKIMDFGIAHLLQSQSITMTGSFLGSPNFMSPEQVAGKKVTEKTDIFSAGLVLYMCATGQAAFASDNINTVFFAIEKTQPKPAFTLNAKLLPCISTLIEKCIIKDPIERPDSVHCLGMIEEFCRSDQFYLKKERIAQLMQTGSEYIKMEEQELFGHYKQKAQESFRLGKKVGALREFAIAGCFGVLTPPDLKIIKRVSSQRKIFKYLLLGSGYICCAFLIAFSLFLLLTHRKTAGDHTHLGLRSKPGSGTILIDSIAASKIQETSGLTVLHVKPERVESGSTHLNGSLHSISKTATADSQVSMSDVSKTKSGFMKIKTSPPWSKIFIDGMFFGEYPAISVIPLTPGSHKIMIKKEGFNDAVEDASISPNDTISKRIELSAPSIPH